MSYYNVVKENMQQRASINEHQEKIKTKLESVHRFEQNCCFSALVGVNCRERFSLKCNKDQTTDLLLLVHTLVMEHYAFRNITLG